LPSVLTLSIPIRISEIKKEVVRGGHRLESWIDRKAVEMLEAPETCGMVVAQQWLLQSLALRGPDLGYNPRPALGFFPPRFES
jgi:hypothetical protein